MDILIEELNFITAKNLKKIVSKWDRPCPYCGGRISTDGTFVSTDSIYTTGARLTCCPNVFIIPRYRE